jgi:hypothetical protein
MATTSRNRSARLTSLVATLLSGVLALQLTLAGSGMLCLMPHHDGMSSMQAVAGAPLAVGRAAVQHVGTTIPASQPCGDEGGQPAQCVTMAACAPSVLPVASVVTLTAPRVPAAVVSAPTIAPHSETSAPELPPPRV